MNRTILIRVTAPAVVLGAILLGACLVSAWHVNRLQANLALILSENVTSLEAAQDLEIEVRQLRFHSFLYLLNPRPERLVPIEEDHRRFEAALRIARGAVSMPEEEAYVTAIEEGYGKYHDEMAQLREAPLTDLSRADFGKLADAHPIRHLVDACQGLMRLNKTMMERTAQDSAQLSRRAHLVMLLLGVLGPLGGLSIGYGMARGLSRSIAQLRVRVEGLTRRLDPAGLATPGGSLNGNGRTGELYDVGSISVAADGELRALDQQLQVVFRGVEQVVERLQQNERELLRSEQLAAVGQLAASVAHEIRNPLAAVKMLVEAARRARNPRPLSAEDLRVIHAEVARLEQTAQGFLDFAGPPAPQPIRCDLRELVAHAVELVRGRARQQGVEVAAPPPPGPVPVHVDRGQLSTVLLNLLINALDAMPHGGRLEIRLGAAEGEVRLAVRDSGAGIVPEMVGRLFTPFASSKPTGTGLGLSISRRVIEDHGGRVTAANRPEGGACFTVILPAVEENHADLADR